MYTISYKLSLTYSIQKGEVNDKKSMGSELDFLVEKLTWESIQLQNKNWHYFIK